MFKETAEYYDAIYHWIDYEESTRKLLEIIEPRRKSDGRRLLDVACGTGKHLTLFRDAGWEIEGLDLDGGQLRIARERLADVPLHELDMCEFDLGRTFDAITNNFSSIGYARTKERLFSAVGCVARHLEPGGVALIEPWFTADKFHDRQVHMSIVDEPELKIARVNHSRVDGNLSIIDFHYVIATPADGVKFARELHELAMFERDEFAEAAAAAGLTHEYVEDEHFRRGLHVFTK